MLAGVLVPFGLLLVIGFWLTSAERPPGEAPPPPSGQRAAPPPPALVRDAPPRVTAPVPPPPLAPADAGPPAPAGEATVDRRPEETPEGLEAALEVLRPAVRRCVDDRREHAPELIRLEVRFRARPDGRFEGYRLESRTWQDPYFEACVEDAFEELTYQPSGDEPPGPVTHTFVLR